MQNSGKSDHNFGINARLGIEEGNLLESLVPIGLKNVFYNFKICRNMNKNSYFNGGHSAEENQMNKMCVCMHVKIN